MPNVRFVEGSAENYDVIYDAEWPIVPREGEFLQITTGSDQEMTWRIIRICHVANANEQLIGTMAWIESVKPAYRYNIESLL